MPSTIEHYAAAVTELDADTDTVSVRVMPYGEAIEHHGETIQYDSGALAMPDTRIAQVLTSHTGDGAEVIGLVEAFTETGDAAYARLRISDTHNGRQIMQLLRDGALDEVSAGVAIDPTREHVDDDGTRHLAGTLDHVVVTRRGAFGTSGEGSRVLAVHDEEDPVPTPTTETYDDAELRDQIAELVEENRTIRAELDELDTEATPDAADHYSAIPLGTYADAMIRAQNGDAAAAAQVEEYALADDTTTTAAGIVPEFYSSEILSIVDVGRPWWSAFESDPIGDYGMTVKYPRVTQKPVVEVQAAQKTEVGSQATTLDTYDVALATYAGATDVAIQLIERSSPAFMGLLFREYGGVYAGVTEAAFDAAVIAGAGNTAILADASADAAATIAALTNAALDVFAGVRRAPDLLVAAPDRWAELAVLADTTGRPLFPLGSDGPVNALGDTSLASVAGTVRGLRLVVSADAAAGSLAVAWSGAAATLEQAPVQLRAVQVGVLGYDVGVYGYAGYAIKYPDGISTLTVA